MHEDCRDEFIAVTQATFYQDGELNGEVASKIIGQRNLPVGGVNNSGMGPWLDSTLDPPMLNRSHRGGATVW